MLNTRWTIPLASALSATVLLGAAPAPATWAFGPEISSSLYSEAAGDNGVAFRAFAAGFTATRRWGRWGAGLGTEALVWRTEDFLDESDFHVALLAGAHGEALFAEGLMRTRLCGGLAVLLEGTENDQPGQAGFYGEVKPIGFRWGLDWGVLGFDPLTLLVVVPAAGGIPIVDVQYRSSLYVELGP